ncbi:MAG TPA: ATP-binding protein, partial [Labilithrix sp.]|nr:ATP-binding protein [Labilithrix sp.]
MPYRSSRVETPKLTAEAGIVDDMVRQFADPYAFLRELVQNGIDAGATRIEVRVERGPDGAVATSVSDDGCGMSRAVIEGPLLTLFESSKESDSTKIGKYGIGFVSVFALEPERVEVRTRAGAESWVVRLFGDHSFELAQGARSSGTGTEVVLVHTMTVEELVEHARHAKEALAHWCRHAHIPITFALVDGEGGGEVVTVNVPLAVHGAAKVTVVEGDERFVVGVGDPGPRGADLEWRPSFCGLYNHGLTLLETSDCEPGLACVRFKIDSPRLAHTLSRDNVRRDGEHRRLLERVRTIVAG